MSTVTDRGKKATDDVKKNSAPQPQPEPRLRFAHAHMLAATPPRQNWLIKGILPEDALIGVIGAPSSFKSAIITDMAVSIAAGVPWHGTAIKRGAAMILAGEGHGGYSRRLKAIADDRSIDLKTTTLYVSRSGLGLLNPSDLALFKEKIESFYRKYKKYPSLVVVDTVARNFGAGDENSASDMGKFIEHMDSLRRKYHCTVVLIHHTGHANPGRARGSSSFKAALDCELTFERKGDLVVISCSKNKDAEKFEPLAFRPKSVPVSWKVENRTETFKSFVMERTTLPVTNPARKQEDALRILKKLESKDPLKKVEGVKTGRWKAALLRKGIISSDKAYEHLRKRMISAGTISQPARGVVRS